jgi:hypothetical protein
MDVTAAVVTKIVRMSRRWKSDLVSYGICIQTSPRIIHRYVQSVQEVFNTLS